MKAKAPGIKHKSIGIDHRIAVENQSRPASIGSIWGQIAEVLAGRYSGSSRRRTCRPRIAPAGGNGRAPDVRSPRRSRSATGLWLRPRDRLAIGRTVAGIGRYRGVLGDRRRSSSQRRHARRADGSCDTPRCAARHWQDRRASPRRAGRTSSRMSAPHRAGAGAVVERRSTNQRSPRKSLHRHPETSQRGVKSYGARPAKADTGFAGVLRSRRLKLLRDALPTLWHQGWRARYAARRSHGDIDHIGDPLVARNRRES